MRKLLVALLFLSLPAFAADPNPLGKIVIVDPSGNTMSVNSDGSLNTTGGGGSSGCAATNVKVNLKGTSNADITVDSTAGGVVVMDALSTRCSANIRNTGTADMRCAPASVTVSTTAGALLKPGDIAVLGVEGAEAWRCIRTTGTSTTTNVLEARP